MPQIIIVAPSYNPAIGGAIVLHKLCHILNNLGYNSSLYTTNKLNGALDYFVLNENYNTKITTEIDFQKDIVIYPEIESFNPLGCNNVVRYILNTYHLPSEGSNVMATWEEKDYWLYFHNLFYDSIREPNFLHIIDTKLDLFKDYGLKRTINACFTYRKKNHERNLLNIVHPSDAIEIPYNIADGELVKIFNTCKRFYSYDTETYLNVLAAQCGCESIIVPYKNLTKEDIINSQPSFKYGLAYGLDNLEYANSTRTLLRKYLQDLETNQIKDTKIAFEKIFKYFNL